MIFWICFYVQIWPFLVHTTSSWILPKTHLFQCTSRQFCVGYIGDVWYNTWGPEWTLNTQPWTQNPNSLNCVLRIWCITTWHMYRSSGKSGMFPYQCFDRQQAQSKGENPRIQVVSSECMIWYTWGAHVRDKPKLRVRIVTLNPENLNPKQAITAPRGLL